MNNIRVWFRSHSKQISAIGKWAILVILLVAALLILDVNDIRSVFSSITLGMFFSYVGILLSSRILYSARWKLINQALTGKDHISLPTFFSTNLLAEFVTIAFPSSIGGEVTRFFKINPHNQDPLATTTGIFIDRLIGITTMILDSIIVLLLMRQDFSINLEEYIPGSYVVPIIIGAVFVTGTVLVLFTRLMRKSDYLIKIKNAWDLVKKNKHLIFYATLISIASHIIFSLSHVVLFQSLFPIPYLSVIGVILTPQLARSIPISLFGISGGEGMMIVSQMMIGLPQNTALVITLTSLFARYFFALCGLVIEILTDGLKFIKKLSNKKEPL